MKKYACIDVGGTSIKYGILKEDLTFEERCEISGECGRTQYHWRVGKCDSRSVKYIFCSCAPVTFGDRRLLFPSRRIRVFVRTTWFVSGTYCKYD